MTTINLNKLCSEFKAAGIVFVSVDANGVIIYPAGTTAETIAQAEAIKAAHNPVWYVDQRRAEYPSWQDQMDMQYHDAVDGTTTWKDAIAAIKAKYPKPS